MSDLLLKRELYSEQAIISTVKIYSQLASITYRIEEEIIEVSFQMCLYDKKTTIMEFENYLIGIENSL